MKLDGSQKEEPTKSDMQKELLGFDKMKTQTDMFESTMEANEKALVELLRSDANLGMKTELTSDDINYYSDIMLHAEYFDLDIWKLYVTKQHEYLVSLNRKGRLEIIESMKSMQQNRSNTIFPPM